MNESRISRWLIIGAMLVAAPRYIGVNAHAEGWLIGGSVWQWVVALSGLGMAVLEGVAVWYCWQKWGSAKDGPMRNVLLGLIVAMLVAFAFAVGPYTYAASDGKLVKDAVSEWLRVVWAQSVSIAPFVVMAASGLAEMIGAVDAQEAHSEADPATLVSQAVEGAINALKPEFERVTQAAQPVATLAEPAVMPNATVKTDERAAQYLSRHPNANSEQVAQHLGVSAARVRALPAWRNRQPA